MQNICSYFRIQTELEILKNTRGKFWTSVQKLNIFFYSFGVDDLKSFIIQDDQKIVEKILIGTEKAKRTGNRLDLLKINFSMRKYNNLLKKALKN